MERTEKIGFAEWCAGYRKTLPESKRDHRIGDFLSDIDSDLHQNPFMAGCCDRKQWMEHIYHHACDDAKAAFCNLWKMYEQETQEEEEKSMLMEIRPITLRQASDFINQNHRHHRATIGCKFCLGCFVGESMVGCAVCGRPVSRYLDDGFTCEVNRLCTDGTNNACSMLYGACCRVAREMGYRKVITYILQSENGASLKASNFTCEGIAGGEKWTGKRDKGQDIPHELKKRWVRYLKQEKDG